MSRLKNISDETLISVLITSVDNSMAIINRFENWDRIFTLMLQFPYIFMQPL